MALIECTECGVQVSDKASACVKCGAPITPPRELKASKGFNPGILAVGGALIVLLGILFLANRSPEAKEKSRARDAISLCWSEQGKKSNSSSSSQFIAGACEKMEASFRARYGVNP